MKIKRTKPGSKSSEAKHEIVKSEQNGNNAASVGGAIPATGTLIAGPDGVGVAVAATTGQPETIGGGTNKKYSTGVAGNSSVQQGGLPSGAGGATGGAATQTATGQNNSMAANNNNNNNNNSSGNNGVGNSAAAGGNSVPGGAVTTTASLTSMTGAAGGAGGVASSGAVGTPGSNKRTSSGHRRDKGGGSGKEKSSSVQGGPGGNSISQRDKGVSAESGGLVSASGTGRTGMLCACPEAASGTTVALQNGSSQSPPCGSPLCVRLRSTTTGPLTGGGDGKSAPVELQDRPGYSSDGSYTASSVESTAASGGKISTGAASLNCDLSSSAADRGSSSPPAKKIRSEVRETHDACVGTSVGTITEPDCLGPCEPGTSVTLEGIVWHETEGGVLVVNVTWRGKTYVGTLLDCTRHDWAPPR